MKHSTPVYKIDVNGVDISSKVQPFLDSLTITDNRGSQADTLSLTLVDKNGTLAVPPTGATIRVFLGFDGEPLIDKGSYIVGDIDIELIPTLITINATSADMRGSLPAQKSRSFKNTTVKLLVEKIAGEHKLTAVIGGALGDIRIGHLDQTSESDLNLLTRLAKRHDAIAAVKDNRLLFIPANTALTASGKDLPEFEFPITSISSGRYSISDRDTYTGVRVNWNSRAGGKLNIVLVGDPEKTKELRQTYSSQAAAVAAGEAELDRLKRTGLLSVALAWPELSLIPESPIKITGTKKDIADTRWIATKVTHSFTSSGGLSTTFEAEPFEA